ncbi:MAG TPA: NUDIX domain-containing protein [bacterium]|nr:NUDIX domain-containing protein [bacterium]
MPAIHLLARVALMSNGHILLAHGIGAGNTFLPGGHVEYNEAVKNVILRELREEFDGEVQIEEFIGVIEQSFEYRGQPYHELNLLFSGRLLNFDYTQIPKSLESHLEFYWHRIDNLREANLLPQPLLTIVPSYYRDRKSSLWTSTMENQKE